MKSDILKSIARVEPAAFTIVMATGALAIITRELSTQLGWLEPVAMFLNALNFIIFGCIACVALFTWPFHWEEVRHDLELPQKTAFYGAVGISFLVLSAQALQFHLGFGLAFALWILGCFLTLAISFAINFHFFIHAMPAIQLFTPVFFIPVGGLVVIPVAGIPLMGQVTGWIYDLLSMINALALGGGLLLYVGLFSLLLQRHYVAEHMPRHLTPTIWIHLAPIGWGGVSFVNYAQHLNAFTGLARLLGYMLWGGCCWWLFMCIILTLNAAASGQMKFSLAYWAFIFPLGAIAVLSHKLGPAFAFAYYFTWALMAALWCIAAFHTGKSLLAYLGRRGHSPA